MDMSAGLVAKRLKKLASRMHKRFDGTEELATIAEQLEGMEKALADFQARRREIEVAGVKTRSKEMSEKKAADMTKNELIAYADDEYDAKLSPKKSLGELRAQVLQLDYAATRAANADG